MGVNVCIVLNGVDFFYFFLNEKVLFILNCIVLVGGLFWYLNRDVVEYFL